MKKEYGSFEQCIFCGKWGEHVGIISNAKDEETYCPYCMKTQKEAIENGNRILS